MGLKARQICTTAALAAVVSFWWTPAFAEVCDKIYPEWDGQKFSVLNEVAAFLTIGSAWRRFSVSLPVQRFCAFGRCFGSGAFSAASSSWWPSRPGEMPSTSYGSRPSMRVAHIRSSN
ncbi:MULTISPECIES: hypothetical protein [unclassified Ensifer]|uniref:hypothetical protein n=1 Tax=unclassified Ensifer TaxID=2633371 RepID=UPI00115FD4F9|nr:MULTISPECIES: hypothetical protein [unclassified Ensifer]MBD9592834.1 hypothetical protein [Ensifer sp. ENS05]